MMLDTGSLNLQWSHWIIDQLIAQQVSFFCLSPGSRVAPLTLAIADHPLAQHLVHFDERGLGYHALGVAKATQMPVAIVVTSGTAVANLLPAIMEASNDRIPLIILTADRPHELRDSGANQTCDQIKLFSPYLRWESDLPTPSPEISPRFLATTIAQAVHRSRQGHPGPVHLNFPFREPLFSLTPPVFEPLIPTHYELISQTLPLSAIEYWATLCQNTPRGLLVVGSLSPSDNIEPLLQFASLLKWPILPDILSPIRSETSSTEVIRYYDGLLKAQTDTHLHPDLIIQVGDRFVSKTLALWLKSLPTTTYLQIANHPVRQDPDHLVTHRIAATSEIFFQPLLQFLEPHLEHRWLDDWKSPSEKIAYHLQDLLDQPLLLTEPGLAHALSKQLTIEWGLFLSNSMPIRDADQFLFPSHPIGPIFGNRGVSGIDGNIATAIGLAQGLKKPIFAVLGDLAFLHDINSLAMLRQAQYPVILIVINNHGGAIFSFLPIAQRKDILEEFFVASHPYQFQPAADLFHLPYFKPQHMGDWEQLVADLQSNPCSAIIEWSTHRADNIHFHHEINQSILAVLSRVEKSIGEKLSPC